MKNNLLPNSYLMLSASAQPEVWIQPNRQTKPPRPNRLKRRQHHRSNKPRLNVNEDVRGVEIKIWTSVAGRTEQSLFEFRQ